MAKIYKGWHLYVLQGKYEINYNNIYIFINIVFIFYKKYFSGVHRLPQKDESVPNTLNQKNPPEKTPQRPLYMIGEYEIKYNNIYIFYHIYSIYILS